MMDYDILCALHEWLTHSAAVDLVINFHHPDYESPESLIEKSSTVAAISISFDDAEVAVWIIGCDFMVYKSTWVKTFDEVVSTRIPVSDPDSFDRVLTTVCAKLGYGY